MASGSGIKGFYKQKKKTKTKKKFAATKSGRPTKVGTDHPTETTTLEDLINDYGEEEVKLRQFDMDMRYGPCLGIVRLQRWERAESMGLNPPSELAQILRSLSARPDNMKRTQPGPALECLWFGRT